MNAREQLRSYLHQLEARLRWRTLLRGAATLAGAALATTLLLVLAINALAFSHASLNAARLVLLAVLAAAAVLGLQFPLRKLSRRHAAGAAEGMFPEFQQRLVTFADRDDRAGAAEPFIELLAADTLSIAGNAEPRRLAPNRVLLGMLGGGLASLGLLLWMISAGPGFLGYGSRLLWVGARAGTPPLYDLKISPGNATVRRNGDQLITALPIGLQTASVRLFARYQSASKWDEISMQPQAGGSGFQFLFAGLPEGVEYYVEAGPLHSAHYRLRVADVPQVKNIKVTYRYPSWTGMGTAVENNGGDLRAVAGTSADLQIVTDRALTDGALLLDDGTRIALSGGAGNVYHGVIAMQKNGMYHVAAADPSGTQGPPLRVSDDYFIEAPPPNPPTVSLVRPGRDYRASPIEEVTVAVKANDDYGLRKLQFHYSVNGGPDKTANLLSKPGGKQADGSMTLSLEDYKMVPGDLISMYATADDARAESRTDMFFVQVDPFERDFSQSQASGGGGGMSLNGQDQISQREKEIIAATFRQQNDKQATPQQAADQATFLNKVQMTLHDQALALAGRLDNRELTDENQEFSDFEKEMNSAAESMQPAADKLDHLQWSAALPDEQKALQHLLRAEATFRQIQVAFGARGGGGGGGGAGRDLASLFDLELDTQKNQYESAQTANDQDQTQQQNQQVDDAMRKLDELARREDELAQQTQNQQSAEQRWQQEMLQREVEQLQQQIAQMAQNGQSSASQSGSQSQSGQQSQQSQAGQQGQAGQQSQMGQAGQQGQSGQQSSASAQNGGQPGAASSGANGPTAQQAAQAALDRLRQANDAMRRSENQDQKAQAEADARQAADRLRQAMGLLAGLQQQAANGQIGSMAGQASQLAQQERAQEQQMTRLANQVDQQNRNGSNGANPPITQQDLDQLAGQRQQLADQVSKLEQQIRTAISQLDQTQHGASNTMRIGLDEMDQADLANRLQQSSDWLRSGMIPGANQAESEIADGLDHLSGQLHRAQQAISSDPTQQNSAVALDQLQRLRDQLAALGNGQQNRNGQPGQQGRNGQPGQWQNRQPDSLSRNGQPGQPGQSGQQGQQGQQQGQGQQGQGQPGQGQTQSAQGGQRGGQAGRGQGQVAANGRAGDGRVGDGRIGDTVIGPYGGGGVDRYGTWIDTGNHAGPATAATPDGTPKPGDSENTIQQGVNALNQMRQNIQDPAMVSEINNLIKQMQNLDPSRFPGNPALVEQLHTQVLSEVDTLELQMRQGLEGQPGDQIRSVDPLTVPPGYRDAVEEYYRKLSGGGNHP